MGNKTEYLNKQGQYHRLDGPAREWNDGYKEWWVNDKRHREDGLPAIEWEDGIKQWWVNGLRHREDGPAVEYNDYKQWYLNGIGYSEEEFHQEVIKLKLKRLVNGK